MAASASSHGDTDKRLTILLEPSRNSSTHWFQHVSRNYFISSKNLPLDYPTQADLSISQSIALRGGYQYSARKPYLLEVNSKLGASIFL
jgi:hypothetical protein